jgi:fucose permease
METKGRFVTLGVVCAVFFSVGVLSAGLGPTLPSLAEKMGSTLSETGALFTALFLGAVASQIAGGPLTDRFGQRPMLFASLVLLAGGLAGVALSPTLPIALVSMLIAGLGDGVIIVAVNVSISQLFATRAVSALNILNIFFGMGAIAGPLLAGFALQTWATAVPVLWTVVLILLPSLIFVPRLNLGPHRPPPKRGEVDFDPRNSPYRSPFLWMLGVLLLLYVGLEVGTGGWLVVYVDRTTTLGLESATFIAASFWMALTSGRILGAVLGAWLRAEVVLMIGLSTAATGGILMALGMGDPTLTVAAVILMGLGLGPTYPTVVALITTFFKVAPGRATGVVVAMGSLGGTVLPWLQGVLLEQTGPAANALYIALGTLAMLATYVLAWLLMPRTPQAAPLATGASPMRAVEVRETDS